MATPRTTIHIFDAPSGGVDLAAPYRSKPIGLQFSTILPGGYEQATWRVKRNWQESWPDLQANRYVVIRQHNVVVFEGRTTSPKRTNDHTWEMTALGYYFSHCMDREYSTTTTGGRNPHAAIQELVTNATSLITWVDAAIDANSTYTVDLSTQNYTPTRPKLVFDEISKYGDASGNVWDVAIWQNRVIYYTQRDKSTPTHLLKVDYTVYSEDPDSEAVRNHIQVQYQLPQVSGTTTDSSSTDTTALTGYYSDQDSIDAYGQRDETLKENALSASAAVALVQTELKKRAWEQVKYSIKTSKVFSPGGAEVPLASLRAGHVVFVPRIGNLFVVETHYDADSHTLEIVPEAGFRRPVRGHVALLRRLRRDLNRFVYDRSSGYAGVAADPNLAPAIHTHSFFDNNVAIGQGTGSSTATLLVNGTAKATGQWTVQSGGASVIGGTTTDTLSATGNATVGGNLTVTGTVGVNGITLSKSGSNLSLGSGGVSATAVGSTSSFANVNVNTDLTGFGNIMGATVIAGQTSDPLTSDALYVNGTAHMGGVMGIATGISGTGTGVYANIYTLNATNTFQYQGTAVSFANVGGQTAITYSGASQKTAVIQEPDGTWTRFVCREGELARFEQRLPLSRLERCLPTCLIRRRLLSRLDGRFTANTDAPYDIMRADRAAYVVAPVRVDSPYQLPQPFGDPQAPATGNEPYAAWIKPQPEEQH